MDVIAAICLSATSAVVTLAFLLMIGAVFGWTMRDRVEVVTKRIL